jgi:hypothetical protein
MQFGHDGSQDAQVQLQVLKGNRIYMSNYATLLICKTSVINMGIKIHNNLPSELKRTENFKVFKNKLESYLL